MISSLWEQMMQLWIKSKYGENVEKFENFIKVIVSEICQKVSEKIKMRDILTKNQPADAFPDIEAAIEVL